MSDFIQSAFIRQTSPQISKRLSQIQQNDHNLSSYKLIDFNPFDFQKTQRMRIRQTPQSAEMSPAPSQFFSLPESQQFQGSLYQLTNQIGLQRQALDRANLIIDYLKQQNEKLSTRATDAEKQLQILRISYKQQIEKATSTIKQLQTKYSARYQSKNETANTSFILSKISKTTPMKIYGKKDESVEVYFRNQKNTDLQQIYKLITIENALKIEQQISKLSQIWEQEKQQIQSIRDQHKYIKQYIQDQILNKCVSENNQSEAYIYKSRKDFMQQNSENILQIIRKYQQQVINWQSYANSLKKQLMDCIYFIQKSSSAKESLKKRTRQYTTQDLMKYICKEVCSVFNKKMAKNNKQKQQLNQILQQLFFKIKNNQILT